MRVPKTELSQLLGAPGADLTTLSPQLATDEVALVATKAVELAPLVTALASRTPATPSAVPHNADIRFEIARALPALWAKAKRDFAEGKATREKDKLRDLLVWLLTKRNATVRQRQTQQFTHEGKATSGRLDIVACRDDGNPPLAIEVDWAYARPSLEKLLAAHRSGMQVMWVCGAKLDRAAAKALRARANAEFGPTYSWLFMFHLEQGWL